MLPLFIILLLERLVIKEGFQSQWIIILTEAQATSLVPGYKVGGWPLVDITFGPSPGLFSRQQMPDQQSFCDSQWHTKEGPYSNVSSHLWKWRCPFWICAHKIACQVKKKERKRVLPYLSRNQKHLLFTGLIFHELVHLVHSCQNRGRKGQQINVRESANLHKSPTPSRETPSWPAGLSNLVTWANRHQNNVEIKSLILPKSKPQTAVSPKPLFHQIGTMVPLCSKATWSQQLGAFCPGYKRNSVYFGLTTGRST